MEYTVLIERKQEGWRAFIPALADLGAEGVSRDEAVRNVQRAAEAYLSALEAFAGDAEALREHFEDIARERQRQRTEAQQQGME